MNVGRLLPHPRHAADARCRWRRQESLGAQTPMMIAFLRYFAAGLVALTVAAVPAGASSCRGRSLGLSRPHRPLMGAMTALIAALGMVPMAKAVGGFLIAPVASGLLGILIWREPPTTPRLAGSALSFLGAAHCSAPRPASSWAASSPSSAAHSSAPTLRHPRRPRPDRPASTLAVQSLLGAGLLAPLAFAGGLPSPFGASRRRSSPRRPFRSLPHPDRRRVSAGGGLRARAFPIFQLAHGDGGWLRLVRRNAGLVEPRRLSAIATGGLVTLSARPAAMPRPPAPAPRRVTPRSSVLKSPG